MESLPEEHINSKSDDELIQGARKGLFIKVNKYFPNQVQQNVTFFNNLSPRNLQCPIRRKTKFTSKDGTDNNL